MRQPFGLDDLRMYDYFDSQTTSIVEHHTTARERINVFSTDTERWQDTNNHRLILVRTTLINYAIIWQRTQCGVVSVHRVLSPKNVVSR